MRNKNAKPVFCITDGKPYASCTDAAEAVGVGIDSISMACHEKVKTVKGKQWCFVKDIPIRILDISNAYQELYEDAMKYRAIEAERKAKEAHKQALNNLAEKMTKRKMEIENMQEQLLKEEQMYEAMRKEFVI